jgi:chemotaxis response regulator CheB
VTIAQDISTSVVFGMPRIAIELDAACHVTPLGRIAAKAIELCSA